MSRFATLLVALFACVLVAPAFARQVASQDSSNARASVQSGQPQQTEPPPQPTERGPRPFRGLFGGGSQDPNRAQTLDLTFSTNGDYIDNLTAYRLPGPAESLADPRFTDSYMFSGATAGLSYAGRWNRVSLQASSRHDAFYYPDFGGFMGVGHSGNVAFAANVGRRFSLNAAQSISYSPFYGMGGMFGPDPASNPFVSNPLYGVSLRDTLQLYTTASASYLLTRRTTVAATYYRQHVQFTGQNVSSGNQAAGASLSYRVSRSTSVHGGYSRGSGDYGLLYANGVPLAQHDFNAGVDYTKALSRTRRLALGFSTGGTLYSTAVDTYYRLLANAYMNAEIGRSWSLRTDYVRGLNWLEGFPEPVYSDRVTLSTSGYLSTRVQVTIAAAYSNGEPGLSYTGADTDMYTGSGHIRYALNRFVGLSAQYLYYHYTFSPDYPMPFGVPKTLDRQSVFVGVDVWVPLFR